MYKKVAVIGAGGHVGFPFSLVLASSGYNVVGVDLSQNLCESLNAMMVPHREQDAEEYLQEAIEKERLYFTSKPETIADCSVVAIMIGTPVDGEGNPRVDDIFRFVELELCEFLQPQTLVVLRSTVAPGTTEQVKRIIEKNTGMVEGKDFYLVFAPERVAQGVGIRESRLFPQLVGAFSREGFEMAEAFFMPFVPECIELTPREAEFGKLITNMYRYVTFALANEFYMIGSQQNLDVHKIIQSANKGYKRMNLPLPGPNVGGPCLFKDGKFLLEHIHFPELIQSSFIINEGMPQYMFDRIVSYGGGTDQIRKIGILGATFKADCDDTRNSLSFKFAKICKRHGIEYAFFDPYIRHPDNHWPLTDMAGFDAFIVMTPHKVFHELYEKHIKTVPGLIIADAWKFLEDSKETTTGIFVT
jgi:UDP-N-acetyl-D-mannosaminuronic acid dehydrogenase